MSSGAVDRDGGGALEVADDGLCGFLRASGAGKRVVVDPPAGVVTGEPCGRRGQHNHRVHDRAPLLDEDAHRAVRTFADVAGGATGQAHLVIAVVTQHQQVRVVRVVVAREPDGHFPDVAELVPVVAVELEAVAGDAGASVIRGRSAGAELADRQHDITTGSRRPSLAGPATPAPSYFVASAPTSCAGV